MTPDPIAQARSGAAGLTIEAIVAVDSPREFRIHPRDRVVAYTAEVGRRAAAVHAVAARDRDRAGPAHRLGEAGQ